jgi:hypothetical protein
LVAARVGGISVRVRIQTFSIFVKMKICQGIVRIALSVQPTKDKPITFNQVPKYFRSRERATQKVGIIGWPLERDDDVLERGRHLGIGAAVGYVSDTAKLKSP